VARESRRRLQEVHDDAGASLYLSSLDKILRYAKAEEAQEMRPLRMELPQPRADALQSPNDRRVRTRTEVLAFKGIASNCRRCMEHVSAIVRFPIGSNKR
jgi:hypothetical protein